MLIVNSRVPLTILNFHYYSLFFGAERLFDLHILLAHKVESDSHKYVC